jgi:hypothetical protein
MIVENKERHGGPYDRGSADRYYNRPFSPHYFTGDTYNSDKIEQKDMTDAQVKDYRDGYQLKAIDWWA